MTPAQEARGRPDPAPRLRTRIALGLVSLVVLGLLGWGAWTCRSHVALPSGLPWERAAYPVRVDGVAARTRDHVEALAARLPPGAQVDLGGDAGRWTTAREESDPSIWIALLTGLAYWAVATFMLAPRAGRDGVAALFGAMMATGLAITISGPAPPRHEVEVALGVVYIACLCLVPAFFVHFAAAFPRRLPLPAGLTRLPWLLSGAAVGIAAWRGLCWRDWIHAPTEAGFAAQRLPELATYALLAGGIVLGLVLLGLNARRSELERERRQVKWIAWGIAIGATPYVFLIGLPRLLGVRSVPLTDVTESLGELVVPAALTIAVVRDRFLDIDVIIRRSVIYTLLAVGAAAVAALVILLAGAGFGWSEGVVTALAVGIPALLFAPARQAVSRWVDRTFFRLRHGHEQSLRAFREGLVDAQGRDAVAAATHAFLSGALEPMRLAVALRDGEGWRVHGDLDPAPQPACLSDLAGERALVAAPHTTALPEVERADFAEVLGTCGLCLACPVEHEGDVDALLLLGGKQTERRYVEEDLKLLSACALQVGRALERLALIERAAEEAMARRAIAEQVRQKADFFARVAHDLRTPLTAIRWSVRNLSEGLAGPLSARQAEYLDSVGAAAGQLGRLVDNLVDLSRLDLGAARAVPERVDVLSVTVEAISALRPIADERSQHVALSAPGSLPPVRGRTEAAFQIVINLLDNALKYAPEGSAVDVSLALGDADGGARQLVLTVRDRGPGLPADGVSALFELFERGPESARVNTKGFGIGLHIVKTWTDSLGGTVVADNHPEGGARFVCRLPVWTEERTP